MATFAQFQQFGPFIHQGVTLTDGKLLHYESKTTTTKTVWLARDKSVEAQPALLSDANGLFTFYADGIYTFVLTDVNDTIIYTWDDVQVSDQDPSGLGSALASASTVVLGTDGDTFHVTGSTTITQLSGSQSRVTLIFDGSPTLTHSSNLVLPGSVNLATNPGDIVTAINEGSGVWRLSSHVQISEFAYAHQGQCHLVKSSTNLVLNRKHGKYITLKVGAVWSPYEIPSTAPTLAPTGLSVNTTYYIYAYMSSGTMTLEASATASAIDSDTGFSIQSGDATKLLVGLARTDASAAWADSDTERYVRSWYHDQGVTAETHLTGDQGTTSTSFVELNSGLRINFLVWAGELLSIHGVINATASATATVDCAFGIDDDTNEGEGRQELTITSGENVGMNPHLETVSLSAGKHDVRLLGATSTGTATFKANKTYVRLTTLGVK